MFSFPSLPFLTGASPRSGSCCVKFNVGPCRRSDVRAQGVDKAAGLESLQDDDGQGYGFIQMRLCALKSGIRTTARPKQGTVGP